MFFRNRTGTQIVKFRYFVGASVAALISCFIATAACIAQSLPVALINTTVLGTPVEYAAARMSDPRLQLRVVLANTFPGGDESFKSMILRSHPIAAIDGAYFSKSTKIPIGDIVINGTLVNRGLMGSAITVDKSGRLSAGRLVWGHAPDWSNYQTVLACGPALVIDGKIDVHPTAEGFHDPHVMRSTARMAIGYTGDNHLLLVKINGAVSFEKEAAILKSLGAVGAINLDAGASTGMYYRGRYIATPSRRLTNIVTIGAR